MMNHAGGWMWGGMGGGMWFWTVGGALMVVLVFVVFKVLYSKKSRHQDSLVERTKNHE